MIRSTRLSRHRVGSLAGSSSISGGARFGSQAKSSSTPCSSLSNFVNNQPVLSCLIIFGFAWSVLAMLIVIKHSSDALTQAVNSDDNDQVTQEQSVSERRTNQRRGNKPPSLLNLPLLNGGKSEQSNQHNPKKPIRKPRPLGTIEDLVITEDSMTVGKGENAVTYSLRSWVSDEWKQWSPERRVSSAKKIVLTYGQNCCHQAKARVCDTARRNGKLDECHAYDSSVMDPQFQVENKHILRQRRGAGYWLWKPYIIYKHLTDPSLPDGSYIVYTDAGAKFIGDVSNVLEFMEMNDAIYRGVLFFGVGFKQEEFCKKDTFILQHCDTLECRNAMQINAFSGFFRKSDYSRTVVKLWLDDCKDPRMITDQANTLGQRNYRGFKDHRHDQAIITNIMNAYGFGYDTTNGPVLDRVFKHDRFKS